MPFLQKQLSNDKLTKVLSVCGRGGVSGPVGTVASLAARVGGTVVRLVRSTVDPSSSRSADGGRPASGWLVVTVFRDPTDIDTAPLPVPLAEFGDRIEVRVRPAGGDKGTELAARLRDRPSGSAAGRLGGSREGTSIRFWIAYEYEVLNEDG